MKFIEEKYLEPINEKVNKYASKHQNVLTFFNDIKDFDAGSIQNEAFKGDMDFLEEVGFILSVIISIINHPHMVNKGEEIVTRSELAPMLSNEMFQKTLRDSKLWIEDDGFEYVPEYVYYYQQIDELKIYENIFIVVLINKIAMELSKYNDYYVSLLNSFNESIDDLSNAKALKAFSKIEGLLRKLKHIKATYFYKAINRGLKPMASIHPTNILVKDRLYNFCFKFYKKMISFDDNNTLAFNVKNYYVALLIKGLAQNGYEIKKTQSNNSRLTVTNKEFEIALEDNDISSIRLTVLNKQAKLSAKYLVAISLDYKADDISLEFDGFNQAYGILAYQLKDLTSGKLLNQNPLNEEEIINKLIFTITRTAVADRSIYSNYCPICKSRSITERDLVCSCDSCESKYAIYKNGKKDLIWFITVRR